jgi:hypothetical protein
MARKLETLTNIAVITVAVLASTVLVRNRLLTRAALRAPRQIAAGAKVSVPGLDWRAKGNTVLMALSPTCHFCTESAPFYRRLAAELSNRPVQLTALFPEGSENKGGEYLKGLGLQVNDVREGSFSSLHIRGTPTLILVDEQGVARNVWAGKLSPETERDVIKTVLAAAPCCTPASGSPVPGAARLAADLSRTITRNVRGQSSKKSHQPSSSMSGERSQQGALK